MDGHPATHAMTEDNEARDFQLPDDSGEIMFCLAGDEIERQRAGVRLRLAEAEAVVGHDPPFGGLAQCRRKAPPQLNAAERVISRMMGARSFDIAGDQVRTKRRPCEPSTRVS